MFVVIEGSVRESCGSIGGCAYFVSTDGPGSTYYEVELEDAGTSLRPAGLPVSMVPGRYTFTFRSAHVSDAVLNGQRQLGPTDATCSTTIEVEAGDAPRIEAVFRDGSCEISASA